VQQKTKEQKLAAALAGGKSRKKVGKISTYTVDVVVKIAFMCAAE